MVRIKSHELKFSKLLTSQEVKIDGYLNAVGAGYRGAASNNVSGNAGTQGETYSGAGKQAIQENYGGGGGGVGGKSMRDGTGRSGGGGGYGTPGYVTISIYLIMWAIHT